MALPTLTLDKPEADKIIAQFGDTATYLDWLAGVLRDELERRAVRAADESVNTARRQAVDAALADIPTVTAKVEAARAVKAVIDVGDVEVVKG